MKSMLNGYDLNIFGEAGRLDISLFLVLLAGTYLAILGIACIAAPARAVHFLEGFASSAVLHYLELVIRLVVGIAFVRYSAMMPFAAVFAVFGWVVIITTVVLFAVPWRLHRRFAQRSVPAAARFLKLIAAASFLAGAFTIAMALSAAFAR